MRTRGWLLLVVFLLALVSVAAAQPQPGVPLPPGGPPLDGQNPMAGLMALGLLGGLFGGGQQPQTVMVVANGIVYVACDGTLTAFDAKTLEKIASAVYWERPQPPFPRMGPPGPPGQGGLQAPGAGGPAPLP